MTPVTLILYDNTINHLHWMVLNYLTPNVIEPVPYTPMNPPHDEIHEYTLYVYTQPGYLGYINIPSRVNFNIGIFTQQFGLRPLTSLSYFSGHTL